MMDHLSVSVLPRRAQNNHVVLPPGGLLIDRTRSLKLARHVRNLLMWSVFAAYPVQRLVDAVPEHPLAKMDSQLHLFDLMSETLIDIISTYAPL